ASTLLKPHEIYTFAFEQNILMRSTQILCTPPSIHIELRCQRNIKANIPEDKQSVFRNVSLQHKKIFTWYEGETSTSELFNGRLHLIDHGDYGKASANLTSIRESDQGWYHCQIIFPNRTPSARNNGTWYHLAVQGSIH
ncbi:hypothetical protein GQX74_010376, partial [Glossina fuscipes]